MPESKLEQLADLGQSVWLDYISRSHIDQGELKEWIDQGLRGQTSNPSIFDKAISQSSDYDAEILRLKEQGKSIFEIYDDLTVKDIQDAADIFKNVYEKTGGLDGYISLEINPLLAHKVEEQVAEGLRLHAKVNRPNLMIKVPATAEGCHVIEALIAKGVNVNATLIFSQQQYEDTASAYVRGLKRLADAGKDVSRVRSVASVFVSRIDTSVDKILDERMAKAQGAPEVASLKGKAAVANSHIILERSKDIFQGSAFKALQGQGAHIQRVLWGSTSTKNPDYRDVKYVEELIAPQTVNTVPEPTLKAFIDHGDVKEALRYEVKASQEVFEQLAQTGVDINAVCATLLQEGCAAFNKAFESLLSSVDKKAEQLTAK